MNHDQCLPARTVLLVAFHFPPVAGSSGLQRTLRFAQHLPNFGWRPIVLTISPGAHENIAISAGNEVPPGMTVERAFGLDASRHFSVFGHYPQRLALPDRWSTWKPFAVRKARQIIRRERVDAIWSTFPIATAHEIGLTIARSHGLPWIAEFRDPMWQGDYPPEPAVNDAWRQLENRIFGQVQRVVVTTPSAVKLYAGRFPAFPSRHIVLIENGYDEGSFARATALRPAHLPSDRSPRRSITLLHSGIVYPSERDPSQLFQAIACLKARNAVDAGTVQVILRASGFDARYARDLAVLGISDIVRLMPSVGYLDALQEMLTVDGLLILQASNCNAQVPAKLFEYLRSGRPILALTDPAGDTASTLKRAGVGCIARLDSAAEIEHAILEFLDQIRANSWRKPTDAVIASYSRESQAGQLAAQLSDISNEPRPV